VRIYCGIYKSFTIYQMYHTWIHHSIFLFYTLSSPIPKVVKILYLRYFRLAIENKQTQDCSKPSSTMQGILKAKANSTSLFTLWNLSLLSFWLLNYTAFFKPNSWLIPTMQRSEDWLKTLYDLWLQGTFINFREEEIFIFRAWVCTIMRLSTPTLFAN
jgi:hypothetical protein